MPSSPKCPGAGAVDLAVCRPVKQFEFWWCEGGLPEYPDDWEVGWRSPDSIKPDQSRLYIICAGRIRGYAPIRRVTQVTDRCWSLVGNGRSAQPATIEQQVQSFHSWRYRWWEPPEERFEDWAYEAIPLVERSAGGRRSCRLARIATVDVMAIFVLGIAFLYCWPLVIWLIHERGHAREAENLTAGPVAITVGTGPNFTMPGALVRALGLRRTTVVMGTVPRRGGYTGRDVITGRDDLMRLYAAGYRATWRATGAVAIIAGVLVSAIALNAAVTYLALAGVLGCALLALDSAIQQTCRRAGPQLREGSDAYVLARMRRHPNYRPAGGMTAQELLASLGR